MIDWLQQNCHAPDPGLAAWLAGVRSVEEAKTGIMRGGLYENLVIIELFKQMLNKGEPPHFFFYRDNHGNEIDLVIKHNRKIIPIEIKSSETFNTDFHKGIAYFHKLVPSSTPGFILYNGERDTDFHGTRVTNPLRLPDDDILM
jgi:predicted AAA+ superfamily ATPase